MKLSTSELETTCNQAFLEYYSDVVPTMELLAYASTKEKRITTLINATGKTPQYSVSESKNVICKYIDVPEHKMLYVLELVTHTKQLIRKDAEYLRKLLTKCDDLLINGYSIGVVGNVVAIRLLLRLDKGTHVECLDYTKLGKSKKAIIAELLVTRKLDE